jgi:hypothetical protein
VDEGGVAAVDFLGQHYFLVVFQIVDEFANGGDIIVRYGPSIWRWFPTAYFDPWNVFLFYLLPLFQPENIYY